MKKPIIIEILCCVLLISTGLTVKGQSDYFKQDQSTVQIGYGFGNFMQAVFKSYQDDIGYDYSSLGPMFIKYEYAVGDKIGIGLNIAYANATVGYKGTYYDNSNQSQQYNAQIKYNAFSALVRINWHFGNSKKFDPYWGFGLGYRSSSYKFTNDAPDYANIEKESLKTLFPLGFETTIGARYLFTDNFGIYAETGIAKAIFQFGLVLRMD